MKRMGIFGLAIGTVFVGMMAEGTGINNPSTSNNNDCDCPPPGSTCSSCSVNLNVQCGALTKWSLISSIRLVLEEHQPSALTATPQALNFMVGNYMLKSVTPESGGVLDLEFLTGGGKPVYFEIPNGATTGAPSGISVGRKETVEKVNEYGTLRYYQLKDGNGNSYYYDARSTESSYLMLDKVNFQGQEQDRSEMGYEYALDSARVIRQVKTLSRLVDIVDESSSDGLYRINIYPVSDIGAKDSGTGLYAVDSSVVPEERWVISNPAVNNINDVRIAQQHPVVNGSTVTWSGWTTKYEYSTSLNAWTMTVVGAPLGVYNTYSQIDYTETGRKVDTRTIGRYYGTTSQCIDKKTIETMAIYDWGTPVISKEESVNASQSRTTAYEYYTEADSSRTGYAANKLKFMQRYDGYQEFYMYDAQGRLSRKFYSFKDHDVSTTFGVNANSRMTEYRYRHNDFGAITHYTWSAEPAEAFADQVLEEIEYIVDDQENWRPVKATEHYYPLTDVGLLEVSVAAYGPLDYYNGEGMVALKTYKLHYPADAGTSGGVWKGKLKFVEYPDGHVDEYTYFRGSYTAAASGPGMFAENGSGFAWKEVVTHKYKSGSVTAAAAGRTTQDVRVWDAIGDEVLTETYVYNGSSYDRIGWKVTSYEGLGHPVQVDYSDGSSETGEWGNSCCGKDSGTDRAGITTSYTYDRYKRLLTEVKNDIQTLYGWRGTDEKTAVTVRPAGSTSPYLQTVKNYDRVGRATLKRSPDSVSETTGYNDANRTETTIYPGGGTRIVTRYRDGRIKSVTGTAVVHEFYDYGVEEVGVGTGVYCETTTKYIGPDGTASPRWVKKYYDMLGRVARVEQPGYSADSTEYIQYEAYVYDARGLLESKTVGVEGTSYVTTTLYEYDDFGTLRRSGLDVNNDGQLVTGSKDRITDYASAYVYGTDGIWYRKDSVVTYPTDNLSTIRTNSIKKVQLTGLGSLDATYGTLVARTIETDVYEQPTITSRYVIRDNAATTTVNEQRVTEVVDVPTSTQDAITVWVGGRMVSETSTTGVETAYTYDNLGRLETKTVMSDADGDAGDERTVQVRNAYYASGTGQKGHLQSVTQVIGGESDDDYVTTYAYYSNTGLMQSENRTATLNDDSSQALVTTYTYDSATRRLKTVSGGQYPVEYGYDDFGHMDSLKTWQDEDSASVYVETTWSYDEATGLLENKRYNNALGAGKGPDYTYYPDGKLKTRKWARNSTSRPQATYTYDNTTRELSQISYSGTPDANQTVSMTTVQFQNYDRFGGPRTVVDAQGARTLSYNKWGMLDRDYISGIYDVNRDFDVYGRPFGYVMSGQDIHYGYDALGRFKTVQFSIGGTSDTFTYDWASGADLLTGYSNAGVSPAVSVAYGYEPNRDLKTRVVNRKQGTDIISQFDYVYDQIGRRKQRTDTRINESAIVNKFNYNARSEVVGADMDGTAGYEDSYSYDDIGNRITATLDGGTATSYTRNNLNQYTTLSGGTSATMTYDDDGNLSTDGTWRYIWDTENRLVEIRSYHASPATVASGDKKLVFAYDYMGRRFSKKFYIYGTGWVLQDSHSFVYDGWNLIQDITSTSKKSFVWGLDLSQTLQGAGGVGGLFAQVDVSGSTATTSYAAGDANGNITDYVGDDCASFKYDAFGKVSSGNNGTDQDVFPIRFSSKYEDLETGLNYYGYRYYSAGLGRWLNRDPIGEEGGVGLYGFVANEGVNYIDVLGQNRLFTFEHDFVWGPFTLTRATIDVDVDCEECEVKKVTISTRGLNISIGVKGMGGLGLAISIEHVSSLTETEDCWTTEPNEPCPEDGKRCKFEVQYRVQQIDLIAWRAPSLHSAVGQCDCVSNSGSE